MITKNTPLLPSNKGGVGSPKTVGPTYARPPRDATGAHAPTPSPRGRSWVVVWVRRRHYWESSSFVLNKRRRGPARRGELWGLLDEGLAPEWALGDGPGRVRHGDARGRDWALRWLGLRPWPRRRMFRCLGADVSPWLSTTRLVQRFVLLTTFKSIDSC
jgi:hypothetical protein